jgi:sugar O-acyltransferase (sialic acid O-acetyltransferase NeuD family)
MGTPLVLVAGGGLAREVAEAVTALDGFALRGCVDDDAALWGTRVGHLDVLGGLDLLVDAHTDVAVVVCAGRGTARRSLVARLTRLGVAVDRYATVVHPSAQVPPSCTVGAGAVLLAQVVLTADVRVGGHVVVMPGCTLTHDDVVEDFATLAAGVSLGGGVKVGEAAYVGMNAAVREHLVVGASAVVGLGSAVTRDVPPGETWAGVPAAALTERTRRVPA